MIHNETIKNISEKIQLSIFIETSSIKLKFLIFFHIFPVIGVSCFFMESLNIYNFDYVFLSCLSFVSIFFPFSMVFFLDSNPFIYHKKYFLLLCITVFLLLLACGTSPLLFNEDYRLIIIYSPSVILCHIFSFLTDIYCIYIIIKIFLSNLK